MRRNNGEWNGFSAIVVPLNLPVNASGKKWRHLKGRSEQSRDGTMISSFDWPTPKQRISSFNNKSPRLLAT
jgi:hypothetical protein